MSEPNYTIVTISNRQPLEPYYCFMEWQKSVSEYNAIIIQGIGTRYQGLCDKPKFLYRAIKQGVIKTEFTIFCDSWDLVFTDNPDNIIDKFKSFKCDVVISSEKNCFPADLKEEYDKLDSEGSSYKYLNSGMIVGYTDKILEMLEAMEVESIPDDYFDGEKNIHFNDQFEFQKIFIKQPVHIRLDYKQHICNTLHSVKLDELEFIENGAIRNKESGKYPSALHMNGSAKTDGLREPILKHLNLL